MEISRVSWVICVLAVLLADSPAVAGTTVSLAQIAEQLDLTTRQTIEFKKICETYNQKRQDLVKELVDADEAVIIESRKRLQREFYEALSQVLSREQIARYKQLISGKNGTLGESVRRREMSLSAASPYLKSLKVALYELELSGLQKQALDTFFEELEEKLADMFYLDMEFDPNKDVGIVLTIQTKLKWILTETQYTRLRGLLAHEPGSSVLDPKISRRNAPETDTTAPSENGENSPHDQESENGEPAE